jgi:hypothetical protein
MKLPIYFSNVINTWGPFPLTKKSWVTESASKTKWNDEFGGHT